MIRMWFSRMWMIDMWLGRMRAGGRWFLVRRAAGREGGEGGGVKTRGQVVKGAGPGVGEDAVEVPAEGAIGPALAVDGQDAVAVDAHVEQVGAGGGQGVGGGDAGAGADGSAAGEGPAVLVCVQGDL
ncbi:MAG: hypothetical protein M8467_12735 [Anaerolineae bacterium]|nr:hypothetical protein [Anaerolineae bacterium]